MRADDRAQRDTNLSVQRPDLFECGQMYLDLTIVHEDLCHVTRLIVLELRRTGEAPGFGRERFATTDPSSDIA